MKALAHQRPDVTLICPALSANLKHDYLDYYTALFGSERPENLVPAMHGYSVDVAALPAAQPNFLEQQAEVLRTAGQFRHVSGTEIGSGNPFVDAESLSEQGRFDDVVIWILLSQNHVAPPGQDNQWSFRIDPGVDDPNARQLADMVNRSKNRVLRNIRERSGADLQILQGHDPDRPAYAVEYVDHDTPAVMVAGQTQAVRMTIRNTSYRTWLAGGSHPFRLGYHWYTSSGDEVPASLWADHRTQLPNDILPDQRVTLTANLGAPREPGAYEVRWDMVEELVTWFAWQGVPTLNVPMTVNAEEIPPGPGGLRLSASHNNRQQGIDNLQQAVDDNPVTRWSSLEPQKPGMWFQIDLGEARPVGQVGLTNDQSPQDYPRGYRVNVSLDGQNWATVAENAQNDRPLNVAFSPRPVRFIRIEQTGSDPIYWWSIHEVNLSGEARISIRASHNNVLTGADNLLQALDGRPDTRWSSRALQQPGMWFEIDLNEVRAVNGLTLDTAGSPNDYPRGYIVRLSTDQTQWQEVARNDRNTQALDVTFTARPARYIRIEQTGSADRWWWSIHEVKVKFDPSASLLSIKASHNNVLTGADNLLQALDDRPDTRWSSRSLQRPGMWVEIDLNELRTVSGLALDTAGSPNDYPRGYIIHLSTDHTQWEEMARNDRNDRALDVTFTPRLARYIRIEQTGSADSWWWSIHQISIKD